MTAPNKSAFQTWFSSLPIPWMVAGPNGQAEATAWPALMDAYVAQLVAARYCAFPDYAPADALSHIGGDRQLEQGTEGNPAFITRLKTAWDDWARAGTAVELLTQLYWAGIQGAIIVQQNGLAYSLSGSPTAGVDPTSLLTIQNLGVNYGISGSPPWWYFDSSNYFCSRFAILLPTIPVSWRTTATAVFTASQDYVDITWSPQFANAAYLKSFTLTVTDASSPLIYFPTANITATGVRVATTARFNGQVDLMAWEAGTNPFANPRGNALAQFRRIVNRWKPAKATCMGAYAFVQGNQWGWPTSFVWGGGATWGSSTTAIIPV